MNFDSEYWNTRYKQNETGWDIGYASPPVFEYFSALTDKTLSILVPGAGKAYEVEMLYNLGFKNVFYLDFAPNAVDIFLSRCPDFPKSNILISDFFELNLQFDFILEQTFFSSLNPNLRIEYVQQVYNLLKPGGKLAGLFFNRSFNSETPPFGGNSEEYLHLFSTCFSKIEINTAENSIKPRLGSELWVVLTK